MEDLYTVYCHESPNGKRYVGVTRTTVNKRWRNGNGYKKNQHFWKAIQRYGWDNFEHYILFEQVSRDFAKNKEKELISIWKTNDSQYGYNIEGGGNIKKVVSETTRQKLSMFFTEYFKTHRGTHLGKPMSEETKKKLSLAHVGIKWSDEHRQKELARRKMNPRKCNEETKQKISKALLENPNKLRKSVCQYDLSGNYIKTFSSICEAVRETGVNKQQLSSCCNGTGCVAGGFMWRFEGENGEVPVIKTDEFKKKDINKNPKYLQYSLDGELLNEYDNNKQLKDNGFNISNVQRCCNHVRKTYKGFVWEYKKGDDGDDVIKRTNI